MDTSPKRDSAAARWRAVLLRSLHLAGVVWVGAAVVGGGEVHRGAVILMLASGLLLAVLDLRAGRIAMRELAGAFVLVKLAGVVWMALDPRQAEWLFWALLLASSVVSHAPKGFRHWPN